MLRPAALVAALTICLTALPDDSAAGACHRRHSRPPCWPCPTYVVPQECPSCAAPCGCETQSRRHRLYFSDNGHWKHHPSTNTDYHSLYKEGKAANRTFRHRSEGCQPQYRTTTDFFTIAPGLIPPPDSGTPATTYYLCLCSGGNWQYKDMCTIGQTSGCPNSLIDWGMSQGWELVDCSEGCGYRRQIPPVFIVCPDSISPCQPGYRCP
jgi:hypothetical protein